LPYGVLDLHPQSYLEIREILVKEGLQSAITPENGEIVEHITLPNGTVLRQVPTLYQLRPGEFAEMSMTQDVETLQKLCRNSYAMYVAMRERLVSTRQKLRDADWEYHEVVPEILAEPDPPALAVKNTTALPIIARPLEFWAKEILLALDGIIHEKEDRTLVFPEALSAVQEQLNRMHQSGS
jgi:hypothetical protein